MFMLKVFKTDCKHHITATRSFTTQQHCQIDGCDVSTSSVSRCTSRISGNYIEMEFVDILLLLSISGTSATKPERIATVMIADLSVTSFAQKSLLKCISMSENIFC